MFVEVKNLTKKYMFVKAIDELSLSFEKGKIIGLLGPNGSGKSTLMRILSGLLQKTSGEIFYEGELKGIELKKRVAYMPTEFYLYQHMTVKECINFYKDFYEEFDFEKAERMLQETDINLSAPAKSLSTGQKGRLKIALTLCRKADLYLIDEPLNGIDPISRDVILDYIKEAKSLDKCIVVSSHLVREFEQIVDDIVFLKKGKLNLKGNADELRAEHDMTIHDLYKEVYKFD